MRYGDMVIERSLFRQGYNRIILILRTAGSRETKGVRQANRKAKLLHTVYWSGRVPINGKRVPGRAIGELRHVLKALLEARMRGQVRRGRLLRWWAIDLRREWDWGETLAWKRYQAILYHVAGQDGRDSDEGWWEDHEGSVMRKGLGISSGGAKR
jgi:hypothetical protein